MPPGGSWRRHRRREGARASKGVHGHRLALLGPVDPAAPWWRPRMGCHRPRSSLDPSLPVTCHDLGGGGAARICESPSMPSTRRDPQVLRREQQWQDEIEPYERVRALLRRAAGNNQRVGPLQIGPLTIDPAAHSVSLAGKRLELRRQEYELLLHLAGDPRRVFRKHELLEAVWGYRSPGTTRTLDSHASRLRRKLSGTGERWVINEWGVGYRLT